MKTPEIVELIAASLMVLGVLALIVERIKAGRGIGARAIQFLAVILIIPSIVILAIEKALSAETTATLFGTLTGYLLSGIGDYKPESKKKTSDEGNKEGNEAP